MFLRNSTPTAEGALHPTPRAKKCNLADAKYRRRRYPDPVHLQVENGNRSYLRPQEMDAFPIPVFFTAIP